MKKYIYQLYDHQQKHVLFGAQFFTKADARRMRNTMNALNGNQKDLSNWPHGPVGADMTMRYTINRVERLDDGKLPPKPTEE